MRLRRLLLLFVLHSAFCVLTSSASDLTVDKRTLTLDDRLTISLILDGKFSDLEDVQIPLQNLAMQGDASSRVDITWSSNGKATYRRTLRYVAKAKAPGPALVGPLVLRGADGAVETLAPISVQVLPDAGAGSNDPETIAHELVATGRDKLFVVAVVDKNEAFVGEGVGVTWMLYNATPLQRRPTIEESPRLDDFWVEDVQVIGAEPEIVTVGDMRMERVPLRRSVLYPLRAGALTVGSMTISAETVRRIGADRYGIPYEGMLVEVSRRSAQVVINARPLPPGPPVAAVGDVTLTCDRLPATVEGPVALVASMKGHANLRSAPAPTFERAPDATLQVVDAGFSVDRRDVTMMRRWRFVLFPAHAERFTVPALTATILTPAGERRVLRCEGQSLVVGRGSWVAGRHETSTNGPRPTTNGLSLWIAGALAGLGFAALAVPLVRRWRATRAAVRAIVNASAAENRVTFGTWVDESSDRGDAVRALLSLLERAERDREAVDPAELRRRARDVAETCLRASRMAQSR